MDAYVEVGAGVVAGVGVGAGVCAGVGVALGKGSEGMPPTPALECSPVFISLHTPPAHNQTSPSSDFTMVKPSPSTMTVNVVPLTTAEPAGVLTS